MGPLPLPRQRAEGKIPDGGEPAKTCERRGRRVASRSERPYPAAETPRRDISVDIRLLRQL
jgi:hypothetical protein